MSVRGGVVRVVEAVPGCQGVKRKTILQGAFLRATHAACTVYDRWLVDWVGWLDSFVGWFIGRLLG